MAKPNNTIPPHSAERPHLFWQHVDQRGADECWNWQGVITHYGYGATVRQSQLVRVKIPAHRLAYYLHYGKDPGDLYVCHTCDNRRCCNPSHLFLGTKADNNHDCFLKGRRARGETSGACLHPERMKWKENHPWRVDPSKVLRGERNGKSKLTEHEVREMRLSYTGRHGEIMQIAKRFNRNFRTVSLVVRRQAWKHVR